MKQSLVMIGTIALAACVLAGCSGSGAKTNAAATKGLVSYCFGTDARHPDLSQFEIFLKQGSNLVGHGVNVVGGTSSVSIPAGSYELVVAAYPASAGAASKQALVKNSSVSVGAGGAVYMKSGSGCPDVGPVPAK